jgi:hypothetical protein
MPVPAKIPTLIFLHILLPLILGGSIYLLFRPSSIPENPFFIYSKEILQSDKAFLKLLINSGPDFCWSYSFTACLLLINYYFLKQKYFWIIVFILVALSEIVQIFLYPHFTFDWKDLFADIAGFALALLLLRKFIIPIANHPRE